MKLVLLPGMDGTGKLFAPLIDFLPGLDIEIIRLPEGGSQDYDSLTDWLAQQLPEVDFLLLAESFSGPIAAKLSQRNHPHLKSILFVASFLSAPSVWKLAIARLLPVKLLSRLPGARIFYRGFCLGRHVSLDTLLLFESVLASVPEKVLKARLRSISTAACCPATSNLPVTYIRALNDRLVPAHAVKNFLVATHK